MEGQLHRRNRGRIAALVLATACATASVGATGAARADDSTPCSSSTEAPYRMQLRALTGPAGADLTITLDTAPGCTAPEALKKIQLKTFGSDGSHPRVSNLTDVAAPGGVANVDLGQLPRNRRVEADVLVQTSTADQTYVVRGVTKTLLRPDLVVASMQAPLQTLATRPIDVHAVLAELNGDVGADATVTLSWGPTVLAQQTLNVSNGARVPIDFSGVALTTPVPAELTIRVSDVYSPSRSAVTASSAKRPSVAAVGNGCRCTRARASPPTRTTGVVNPSACRRPASAPATSSSRCSGRSSPSAATNPCAASAAARR